MLFFMPAAYAMAQEEESYIDDTTITTLKDHDAQHIFDQINQTNDTLFRSLEIAYQNNPTLQAARAELNAVREQLPQAEAGFKPTVTANADVTHTDTETVGNSFVTSDGGNTSKSGALNLNQPIFRGGSTMADIGRAKNTISAQALALSATEQNIIYQAVIAYMDVLQAQSIVGLNENNISLVSRELEQAQNRFSVGELTRTDVSQSESRLADARANLITAQGQLKAAMARYQQIIGAPPPANMAYPSTKIDIPDTLEGAIELAESNNRQILQAKFVAAAAEDNVDSVFGELLPQISALGRLDKSYDPSSFVDEQRQASIGLSASIPLYEAGATRSRVREAKKRANQNHIQIVEARDAARQTVITNWENLQTAQAVTKARQSQIDSARIAREGVQYEAEFGERTTLDALDANQELLNAQVNMVTSKRDEVVARFALAESLGILVPQKLGFPSVNP